MVTLGVSVVTKTKWKLKLKKESEINWGQIREIVQFWKLNLFVPTGYAIRRIRYSNNQERMHETRVFLKKFGVTVASNYPIWFIFTNTHKPQQNKRRDKKQ